MTFGQYEDYDLDTVCAPLIDSIARNHGFRDGNKRTALMVALVTYRMNKVSFEATNRMNKDFDDTVMWVVQQKPAIREIEARLKQLRKIHVGKGSTYKDMMASLTNHLKRRS